MVKAKVLVTFRDREHMENVYQQGGVFEGTQERVNELAAGGYVKQIPQTQAKKAKPTKE